LNPLQQLSRAGHISGLGNDLRNHALVHLDDVRDTQLPGDGSSDAADRRVWVRYFHEPRAGTEDPGRWPVLHAEGLHQGRGRRPGCVHLCGVHLVLVLDAPEYTNQLGGPAPDDPAMRASAANLHPSAAHAEGGLRAVPGLQGDPARIHAAHPPDVHLRQLRCSVVRWSFGPLQ